MSNSKRFLNLILPLKATVSNTSPLSSKTFKPISVDLLMLFNFAFIVLLANPI